MIERFFRPKPIVQQVIDLLERDHDGWTCDATNCKRPGVSIWIANGAVGLDLIIAGRRVLKGFDKLPMQRRLVWKAFQRWSLKSDAQLRIPEAR